jgi:low temperature requirement protein LtrA
MTDTVTGSGAGRDDGAVRPPVLRTAERAQERRATWTELFFDLVFVVAVSRINQILAGDQSRAGVLWFLGVFIAVTWSWNNFVMYAERFDTDDVVHRLAKAAAMFAVAAVAFAAPEARGPGAVEFAVGYLALRLVLVGLYVRAWRHIPEVRGATTVYVAGFGLGAACWAVSLALPSDARPVLWVIGGAIELLTPLLGWPRFGEAAIDEKHLEERSGQFTLIVLGEAVAASVGALTDIRWDGRVWAVVIAAALIVFCLWWLTFDFVEVGVPTDLRGLAYVYAHIPVYVAIAAIGVGIELVLHHVGEPELFAQARWALCGAGALYLLGVAAIRASADPRAHALAVHPLAAAVLLGVAVVGGALSGAAVLYVIAAVLGGELFYKARLHAKGAED